MTRTLRRTLPIRTLAALAATVAVATPGSAQDPSEPPPDTAAAAKDPLQEGLPLEPTRTLRMGATEGSWMSVDVSPDGRTPGRSGARSAGPFYWQSEGPVPTPAAGIPRR